MLRHRYCVLVGFWWELCFGFLLVWSTLARLFSCEHASRCRKWCIHFPLPRFFSHFFCKLACVLVQLRLRIVAFCYFPSSICWQDGTLFLFQGWNFPLMIKSLHWICSCLPMMCIALAMGIYDFLISFSFQSTLFLCDFCCTWGKCGGIKVCPFSNGSSPVSVYRPR